MTRFARLLAPVAALAALAGCPSTTPQPVGLLNEPSAVAVFRGVTVKSGRDASGAAPFPYRPYLAVANAGSNDLSIFDGVDDSQVLSPVVVRGLSYPVPGRPTLLVSAALGDDKPDLLVAVTAGDLPGEGGSRLSVIRTWVADGAVVDPPVDLGADVLALQALPPDPANPGTAQLVAALAGERIAVVTFRRSSANDGTGIDPAAATASVSAPLGFQPVDVALLAGDRTHVYAATPDAIPGGGLQGVAQIDLTAAAGTVWPFVALNAHAPTRLVAAASLVEADELASLDAVNASSLDRLAFTGSAAGRIYAVLDESGCGLQFPIACGLVAIDPVTRDLAPDPAGADSAAMRAPFRAPIQLPAVIQALTAQPQDPQLVVSLADPGSFFRISTAVGYRQTTGSAGLASTDGLLTFVDLGRWDVPSDQSVRANVTAVVTPTRPQGTPGAQWIVLRSAGGGAVFHLDKPGLAAAVGVTAGYTPSDTWTVTREGILPKLQSMRAEPAYDGTPSIALQQTLTDGLGNVVKVSSAVRVYDPMLGVHVGDTVVLEPTGLSSCLAFEATITELVPPDPTHPGGWVRLGHRDPTKVSNPYPVLDKTVSKWGECVDLIPGARSAGSSGPFFSATFRSAEYVLTRGVGASALHVGRPLLEAPFAVQWQDEAALAAGCTLPPAAPWVDPRAGSVPACDAACRAACEDLLRARLARRLSYVPELPASRTGPALRFTLTLEQPTQPVYRDMALTIASVDGKAPFRVGASIGAPVDPRAVVAFDREPWAAGSGVRFIVPFAGGVVLDGTTAVPLASAPGFTIQ